MRELGAMEGHQGLVHLGEPRTALLGEDDAHLSSSRRRGPMCCTPCSPTGCCCSSPRMCWQWPLHRRLHGIDLLPRVWRGASADPGRGYRRLGLAAAIVVAATIGFAIRGFVTLGPLEEPRDYLTTTPFHRPTAGEP